MLSLFYAEIPIAMKTEIAILASAATLGVLSDLLFHDSFYQSVPSGLNIAAWIITLVVSVLIIARGALKRPSKTGLALMAPVMMLAFNCSWRDSATLRLLDLGVLAFCLSLSSSAFKGYQVLSAGLTQYLSHAIACSSGVMAGPFKLLFADIDWANFFPPALRKHGAAILRGIAIALPLLALFGLLFMAADAAFEGVVHNSLHFDLSTTFKHVGLTLFSALVAAGFLHTTFFDYGSGLKFPQQDNNGNPQKLGSVELAVILGSMDLLFLSFVIVQFKYFFGGAALVGLTANLSYAEYARRGFFELVTVAALVLPILLTLDWLTPATRTGKTIFRALAGGQIALLFVIMVSALQRMRIYQLEYGLTELRLYTTAFMLWTAVVCVIFSCTVLTGKRKHFAFATFISGLFATMFLHFANPDALITKVNIARAKEGKTFDVPYALSLSNDAVPVLMAHLNELNESDRKQIAGAFLSGYSSAWKTDWRAWNWSRSQAFQSVHNHKTELQRLLCIKPSEELPTKLVH